MSILQGLVDLLLYFYHELLVYPYVESKLSTWLAMLAIVVLGGLTYFFSQRLRRGQLPILRGIDGVFDLQRNLEAAAEAGKTVHFSPGTGGLADGLSLQTLAGIDVLKEVSAKSALAGPPLVATTASALVLPVLEGTIRRAYAETSSGTGYEAENNRFISPDPVAYAAGVMRVVESENVGYNVMVGSFGDEYLLMGEAAARQDAKQLVATADWRALPFVVASANYPLIGEELFALSSYLRPLPARIGSLMAQDFVRLVVVALILVLVIAVSLDPGLREWVARQAPLPGYP